MREDGVIASQSSTFELAGVRGWALKTLCAPDSIVRRASRLTVLFCGSSGRAERRRRTDRIKCSPVPRFSITFDTIDACFEVVSHGVDDTRDPVRNVHTT